MEIVALGILILTAGLAYTAVNGYRSASRESAERARGYQAGPGGTAERLAGLLSAWTGQKCHVHPYTFRPHDPAMLNEEVTGLRLTVDGLCGSVTFWRPGFLTPAGGGSTMVMGDADLEPALSVAGSRTDALALLTAATRGAIRELLRGGVRLGGLMLDGGTLTVEVPTNGFTRERPGLEPAARAIAGLAGALKAPADVVDRLCENVARDPSPGVRLQNLRALVDAYPTRPETRAAVTAAQRDTDAVVRLEAAMAAGRQGHETLVALAVGTAVEADVAISALEALGSDLPLGRVDPLMREAEHVPVAQAGRDLRVRAFIAVLGRCPSSGALPLLERLARTGHEAYGASIVSTIVEGHRPEAEGALIRILTGEGPVLGPLALAVGRPRMQEDIARRLGAIGTAEALDPLRAAAQRHGGAVASSARRSIAAIQERLAGSRGRLALSESEAGRLSDADDESGRVAFPDEDS
jgi:hypothetical protein